jgi:hypothetical protein
MVDEFVIIKPIEIVFNKFFICLNKTQEFTSLGDE